MNKKSQRRKYNFLLFTFAFLLFTSLSQAQTPAPGKDAHWATAGKQAVGTSVSLESKVWFTLAQGVMTEVYYPDVTVANVHLLQFVVVNGKTKKVETEQDDAVHEIKVLRPDSLTFQQINTAKSGAWRTTKTYFTDPKENTVLINLEFEKLKPQNDFYDLYVYFDPSVNNSGMHDSAYAKGDAGVTTSLITEDGNKASALITDRGFSFVTNGFLGVNDGLTQLKNNKLKRSSQAKNGNVVQLGKLVPPKVLLPNEPNKKRYNLALGFGENGNEALQSATDSLSKNVFEIQKEYEKGWSDYVKTLRQVEPKYQAQFNMAAMILRAYEDKIHRGANIASLSIPWGGDKNANENTVGGYHLVWSRDLYQVFTAYMALGDKAAAERALDFLFKVQQKPDGSFPQNSWLDGKPFWGSLQMDEVAYPLIMAWELKRFDKATWENHVKKAADFIVKNGPATPQERWEEEGGYSPSTIAAEIAGLVCAAEIAKANSDLQSANLYLKTADEWQANVEKWTVTKTGKYSKEPYYVRITQNGKPDAGEKIELNNGAGFFDEREVVDAGFLELVRLGIKSPDDKIIRNSLKVIDEIISVKTPNGDAFYRYNHDGYGEMEDGRRWNWDGKYTGKGRLWALLSGERGQYELAFYNYIKNRSDKYQKENPSVIVEINRDFFEVLKKLPFSRLDSMLTFANEGLMIPEQIWDSPNVPKNIDKQFIPELKFGEGTGSATPLAWSMAQFIRLAVNLKEGKNLDTPQVVYDRYVLGKKSEVGSQKTEEKSVADNCEKAQSFRPKGNGVMSEPRKNDPSPQLFALKGAEKSKMVFAYFGSEKTVEIAGDFTNWKPCGLEFQNFPNSKILTLEFPNSARVEYKLIVDGKWITDPLNPKKTDNGVGGENSFFTMPDYQPLEWGGMVRRPETVKTTTFEINSKIYGRREIKVYIPFFESAAPQSLPVMYFQDGTNYLNRTQAIEVQQNLVDARKIKPFIMVFLDPKDRMKEYWANDNYAKFLAEEVVPAIDKSYKTIKSREGRAILGASLGGITSVHVGLKYPQIFGRIGGQSSSFWIDNERIVKELEKLDASKNKFKFYFDDGTLEGVEDSRKVVKLLKDKGFGVAYLEAEAGHNWTAWRDRLADALIALWK